MEDAFGMSTEWVGLTISGQIFSDPTYLNSFKRTALFSVLSLVLALPPHWPWPSLRTASRFAMVA
jgi:ABC-type sugar transport system permease subunit